MKEGVCVPIKLYLETGNGQDLAQSIYPRSNHEKFLQITRERTGLSQILLSL